MKPHWTVLPIIIVGVAIGTLIALWVAAQVAQQKLQSVNSTNLLANTISGSL